MYLLIFGRYPDVFFQFIRNRRDWLCTQTCKANQYDNVFNNCPSLTPLVEVRQICQEQIYSPHICGSPFRPSR